MAEKEDKPSDFSELGKKHDHIEIGRRIFDDVVVRDTLKPPLPINRNPGNGEESNGSD